MIVDYKISVIIPAYNCASCIDRAINSVNTQTYKVHEIVVVDDCSDDNLAAIVGKYANVRYFRLDKNSGAAKARNVGIDNASGNWIAFLDADDEWLPEKIQKQVDFLQANPNIVWCCSNYYKKVVGEEGNGERANSLIQTQVINYFPAETNGDVHVCTPVTMLKKDVLGECGKFNNELLRHQDWDLWWRIAYRYPAIGYVGEPLTIVHLGDESSSMLTRLKAKKGVLFRQLIKEHLSYSADMGKFDEFAKLARRLLKRNMLMLLFLDFRKEILETLSMFKVVLPLHSRIFFRILAFFPFVSQFVRCSYFCMQKVGLAKKGNRNWQYLQAIKKIK